MSSYIDDRSLPPTPQGTPHASPQGSPQKAPPSTAPVPVLATSNSAHAIPSQFIHFIDASGLYDLPPDSGGELARRFAVKGVSVTPEEAMARALAVDASEAVEEVELRALWILYESGSFRAAALFAAHMLAGCAVAGSDGSMCRLSAEQLMETWLLRLSSLVKLGFPRLADGELERLGDFETDRFRIPTNSSIPIPRTRTQSTASICTESPAFRTPKQATMNIVCFPLRLFAACLPSLLGAADEALSRLAQLEWDASNQLARASDVEERTEWTMRALSCRIESVRVLLNSTPPDYANASRILRATLSSPLFQSLDAETRATVHSSLGRILLQMGALDAAQTVFDSFAAAFPEDTRNALHTAWLNLARGSPESARELLNAQMASASVKNTLSVASLYATPPDLGAALAYLTGLEQPEHPMLWNLATLSELADFGGTRKLAILSGVAGGRAVEGSEMVAAFKMG